MKRVVLLLFCFFVIVSVTSAQYSSYKSQYDYRTYSYQPGDPYNPTLAGVASFQIPGLGQVISAESGRGLAFFGGYVGCIVLWSAGFANLSNGGSSVNSGVVLVFLGGAGLLTVSVWSIVDAVRVAKVNNLAFRDQTKPSFNIEFSPYFGNQPVFGILGNQSIPVGLSIRFSF